MDNVPAVIVQPSVGSGLATWKTQFYRVPDNRYRSTEEMANVSALIEPEEDRYFIQYLTRSMHRQNQVYTTIRTLAQKMQYSAPQTISKAASLRQFTIGRDSIDAAFKDVFTLLYAKDPRLRTDGPPSITKMCNALVQSCEMGQTRAITVGDPIASAMIALKILKDSNTSELLSSLGHENCDEKAAANGTITAQQQSLASAALSNAKGEFKDGAQDIMRDIMGMAEQIAGAGTSPAVPGKMDIINVEAIASMISAFMGMVGKTDIKHLLDILGRLSGIFGRSVAESIHGDGEVIDVVCGNDISKSMLSEITRLATDDLELLTLKKAAEGLLLSKLRRGVDDTGNGPLIICVDISSSMNQPAELEGKYFTKNLIVNGFALEAAMYATRENRAFAILPFNTQVDESIAYIPKADDRPSNIAAGISAAVTREACGGTYLGPVLSKAASIITENDGGPLGRADVVIFTDGEVADAVMVENVLTGIYKEFAIRTYGILIGRTGDAATLLRDCGVTLVVETSGPGGMAKAMSDVVKAINEHAFDIE